MGALVANTPSVILDGMGGVFVVWSRGALFGEHVCADGTRLWGTVLADGGHEGRDLLGIGGLTTSMALSTSDGQGGFFSLYGVSDGTPTGSAVAQRFSATGAPQWSATAPYYGGTALGGLPGAQDFQLMQDGVGGIIAAFRNFYGQIVLHRLDPSGGKPYGDAGVDLGGGIDMPAPCPPCEVAPDGLGGAYVMWQPAPAPQFAKFAHVDPSGALTFRLSDVPVDAKPRFWSITSPEGGGPWASWVDDAGTTFFLQHFDGDSGVGFIDAGSAGGIPVAAANDVPYGYIGPMLFGDGANGTVLIWADYTPGNNLIFASRFGTDGSPLWSGQPIQVTNSGSYNFQFIRVFPTKDGALLVFWAHPVTGIYAEKLRISDGARLWGPATGGVTISDEPFFPGWVDVAVDSDNGAFVAFNPQNPAATSLAVGLKHVLPDGTLGGPPDAGCVIPPGFDAGAGEDAGTDGGFSSDAGQPADGGAAADGGPVDAGSGSDGGPDAGRGAGGSDGGLAAHAGCGCGSTGGSSGAMLFVLVLLAVRPARRIWRSAPAVSQGHPPPGQI
jgi:hypothetical protein